jgi:hypothetical protein
MVSSPLVRGLTYFMSQDRVSNAARLELRRGAPDDPAEIALLDSDKPGVMPYAVKLRVFPWGISL